MYVDNAGYAAHLDNLIRSSDAGVIGITGVRGSGKSALLGYVLSKFKRQHGVLWMTAPVSHERGMAFLMSVCRALCNKVLRDAEPILYGRTTERGQAASEFLTRGRAAVLIALLVAAIVTVTWQRAFWSTISGESLQNALTSQTSDAGLPFPARVRLDTISERAGTRATPTAQRTFAQVLDAERKVIRALLGRISLALRQATPGSVASPRPGSGYLLSPIALDVGFNLVFLQSSRDISPVLSGHLDWTPYSEEKLIDFSTSIPIEKFYLRCAEYFFQVCWTLSNDSKTRTVHLVDAFYFSHYVMARPLPGAEDSILSHLRDFMALELIRGHPAIEAHLRAHTAALRRFLKSSVGEASPSGDVPVEDTPVEDTPVEAAPVEDTPVEAAPIEIHRPTELASILILNAFRKKSDGLFFDPNRLRQLAGILREYVSVLNGETLVREENIVPDTGEPPKKSSAIERYLSIAMEYWPFILVAILVIFAERIWRLMNFVLRGLINFKLLNLVRESEDFLQFLYYTEGRESSSKFSFYGLSLGGKKVLTARALTLQGLTDRYLDYVGKVCTYYNGKLIIAIDELDKIADPKEVRDVLLEIKGALSEKGCFYLISISEDCARAFRGRLSEGRDIFESSFDDVLAIDQMDQRIATEMIRQRLKTSPESPKLMEDAILILTVFGGGIPREIVRNLRSVCLAAGRGKRISARRAGISMFREAAGEWMSHLSEIPTSGPDAIALRDNAQDIMEALDALSPKSRWSGLIRETLDRSITILDPDDLRLKARPSLAEETERNTYDGVIGEVQHCIRLMVMDCVLEKFWRKDPRWKEYATQALECSRVLMDHPALAEAMIRDMRAGRRPGRELAAE